MSLASASRTFAIAGHPVSHSLSPLMHETAFRALGLPHRYIALDVEPAGLHAFVSRIRSGEISGASITIPHKLAVIPMLDGLSPEARVAGAVNTIVVDGDKLIGHNTDILGVSASLQPFQPRIAGRSALVLGSGGAARAVLYALVHSTGVSSVTITARNLSAAESLASLFRGPNRTINVLGPDAPGLSASIREAVLIVNTTPVGMAPHFDRSPLPPDAPLASPHVVFDVVYRPLRTSLLLRATAAGCTTIGGLEMFLQQGAAAFRLWTGAGMPVGPVRAALEDILSGRDPDPSASAS